MSDSGDEYERREDILLQDDINLAGANVNGVDTDPCGYYASLGVSQDSSQAAIRRAFLQLSQIFHTDKHVGEDEEIQALMNERFQQLMEAYSVLSDEGKRAAYDASGKLGLNRYSLIPKEITQREDILRYMSTLEREAELLKLSKLLSASSRTTVSYSVDHLTNSMWKLGTSANDTLQQQSNGVDTEEAGTDEGETETPPKGDIADAANGAEGSSAQPVPLNTSVAVREVQLDGKNLLVLIPGDEVQQQLRQQLQHSTGGGSGGSAAPLSPEQRFGGVPLAAKLLLGLLPRKLHFEHSIHHYASPSFSVRTKTEAQHEGMRSVLRCTAIASYQPNPVTLYSISWRLSVARLHIACTWERILNNLWRLKSKLVLFNTQSLLPMYELSLKRMLAAGLEVENTWVMSMRNRGLFRTTIGQSTPEGAQRGLQFLVGYRSANVSLFSTAPVVWGGGEPGCGGVSRGVLEHSVSVDALRGRAHVGFSSWYTISKHNRIGVGFSTALPCPRGLSRYVSPFVDHPEYLSINEMSFLLGRGDHLIRIPVVVFHSPKVQSALLWLTAPVLLYRIGRLVMRPYQSARMAALYRQNRLDHRTEMDVARVRATHEQKALQSSSLRSRMAEEQIGGLVIINARYGVLQPRYPESLVLPPKQPNAAGNRSEVSGRQRQTWWRFWRAGRGTPTPSESVTVNGKKNDEGEETEGDSSSSVLVLDVTVPLQNFVRDSQLVLPEGSKSKLVGFTDPDPFTRERKQLKIVYRFQRRRHVVILDDEDIVRLPQREHLVES
ncbi:chaperone protein DNAj [Trypanosoma brucei equiperdum]|uniref:Chaperone protein DNAj n=1 Tax=Trypanosoma brucei equiperdum TaxID=630700 RepID=A0A3L6L570_9TRYP|nr:chaperone protein DNAj [Trypanosoma brucei equiperdum]